MPHTDPVVSTGRGGAGNIGHDPTVYTDGGIVREGAVGEESHGKDYSTGRGGAGNVGTPKLGPQAGIGGPAAVGRRGSQDFIPETSLRPEYDNYHTGRGGEGNVHREHPKEHHDGVHSHEGKKEGLVDKAKHILHLDGKKDKA